MLSKTAETNPRPNVVCHDAAGSASTGINDADSTSDSRKAVPLSDSGSTDQSGRLIGAVRSSTIHTVAPRNGMPSAIAGNRVFTTMLAVTAAMRMAPTMPSRAQSTTAAFLRRHHRRMGVLLASRKHTRHDQRRHRRTYA